MPGVIDPETINVDDLPPVWTPVQWELTDEERIKELEEQATASLLWSADAPEAMLRLLLSETEIERAYEPPPNYDPEAQGEWDDSLVTFQFRRQVELLKVEREPGRLYVEYKFSDLGYWGIEIEPDGVNIARI